MRSSRRQLRSRLLRSRLLLNHRLYLVPKGRDGVEDIRAGRLRPPPGRPTSREQGWKNDRQKRKRRSWRRADRRIFGPEDPTTLLAATDESRRGYLAEERSAQAKRTSAQAERSASWSRKTTTTLLGATDEEASGRSAQEASGRTIGSGKTIEQSKRIETTTMTTASVLLRLSWVRPLGIAVVMVHSFGDHWSLGVCICIDCLCLTVPTPSTAVGALSEGVFIYAIAVLSVHL
jgi:hypothetical protein